MRRIATLLIVAAALLGSPLGSSLGLAPKPAAADRITYGFSGVCGDCSGTVTATLVLDHYTPGAAITTANFVSFHYDGSNLLPAYTITPASLTDPVTGRFPAALPAAVAFSVTGNPTFGSYIDTGITLGFATALDGNWGIGASGCFGCLDNGPSYTWSEVSRLAAIPAPGALGLFALGLAALYPMARRTSAKA